MAKKAHVTTTVIGDEYEFLCEPGQTLVDALRNEMGLTGTKEGCSTGDCGACDIIHRRRSLGVWRGFFGSDTIFSIREVGAKTRL